jgi:hypothetical protein
MQYGVAVLSQASPDGVQAVLLPVWQTRWLG